MAYEEKLNEACVLFDLWQDASAFDLLDTLVRENKGDPDAYDAALNASLYGRQYDKALDIIDRCMAATGYELTGDFDRDEIRQMKRTDFDLIEKYRETGNSGSVKFKRIGLFDRKQLTDCYTLRPVKEIVIGNAGMNVATVFGSYRYAWADISEIVIHRKKLDRLGAGVAENKYIQTIIKIVAGNKKFRFDASNVSPDFVDGKHMVDEIKKYFPIKEGQNNVKQYYQYKSKRKYLYLIIGLAALVVSTFYRYLIP